MNGLDPMDAVVLSSLLVRLVPLLSFHNAWDALGQKLQLGAPLTITNPISKGLPPRVEKTFLLPILLFFIQPS